MACRTDDTGALVLSEFTGAADQLTQAILVNPHDINAMKDGILRACNMTPDEQRARMRPMRERLKRETVHAWSRSFLETLARITGNRPTPLPPDLQDALTTLAHTDRLAVALDFDGVLAPLVDDPTRSVPLEASIAEVVALSTCPRTRVAVVSGRNLAGLHAVYEPPAGTLLYGSHGAETTQVPTNGNSWNTQSFELTQEETDTLTNLDIAAQKLEEDLHGTGFWVERKPLGRGFHTRKVARTHLPDITKRLDELIAQFPGVRVVRGHDIVELTVRKVTKGDAALKLQATTNATGILYVGDDVTDEDAFRALADVPGAVTIKVGEGDTAAKFRVATPQDVTHVLFNLRVARQQANPAHSPNRS